MIRRSLPLALAALATAAGPAAAATETVHAPRAVARDCSSLTPADARRPGVAAARFTPSRTGIASVTLRARRGDWDLTVLDAATGYRHNAAASFGARERTIAATTPGRPVLVLACRRSGSAARATIGFDVHPVDLAAVARADHARLVRVALSGHRDLERLEATGLDVTHNAHDGYADVVLYTAADTATLLQRGFTFEVLDANLRATTRRELAARASSGLPSKRTTYRTLADYETDLKRIVEEHPEIARPVTAGSTLEGRAIEGVELATDVHATDDGRPTLLLLGVHHAREWPSGEMPMEFAIDLADQYARGSDRAVSLLQRVRVVAIPVVNKDGFEISRSAGPTPFDDGSAGRSVTLPLALTDAAAYKRKNCRPAAESLGAPESRVLPCATRPAAQGVDLNRNYGAYWGGVGSSPEPTSQQHRGSAPYSEPESEAIHRLSSTRQITTVISHHTFWDVGIWLRQPGFCKVQRNCSREADVVPDEHGMGLLGDGMADATGWQSDLGWRIGEITGATEDWNYFAQSAFGYTPEQRGSNFHPAYETAVVREFDGTGPGADGGVREALMRAAEQAADPAWHSVVHVKAARGRRLHLRKKFATPTSQAGVVVQDALDFSATVPAGGRLEWHVNPSTRPLSTEPEAYVLTCEAPDGTVLDQRDVVVARGGSTSVALDCAPAAPLLRGNRPATRR